MRVDVTNTENAHEGVETLTPVLACPNACCSTSGGRRHVALLEDIKRRDGERVGVSPRRLRTRFFQKRQCCLLEYMYRT